MNNNNGSNVTCLATAPFPLVISNTDSPNPFWWIICKQKAQFHDLIINISRARCLDNSCVFCVHQEFKKLLKLVNSKNRQIYRGLGGTCTGKTNVNTCLRSRTLLFARRKRGIKRRGGKCHGRKRSTMKSRAPTQEAC